MAGNSLKKLKGSLHYIPTGRQLPRTPPPFQVKQRLEFHNEDEKSHIVEFKQDPEGGSSEHPDLDVFQVNDTKPGAFSDSLVNGMKDYQLTASDQDFMMKMQVEKQIKQLEGELVELRNMLQTELVLESMLYPGDNVQAELQKSSSYPELVAHHKKVLGSLYSSVKVLELKAVSLLAIVSKEDVDRAPSKKKGKKQAVSQQETSWRKEDTNEREHLAEQLVGYKTTIQQLMRDLADLKSKLAQIEMDRQEVVTPTAPKTNLPTSRKAAGKGSNDPSKSKAKKIPKGAAGQQTPADELKPKRGARGRPKAVTQEAAAATSPVQSVKQADEVKRGRPAGRRLKEEKKEEQANIVLRRSKRIANRK
ncbi:uncharacterized protein [Syngnathus scovelli]|uniref:uncharacterized protein isoform X2 n=1 Tax=Syngnathus scovelli TaxID=161590 RepID=UPI0021108A76|nr:uncharacterized protein LOC125988286 isoform X2 [Syngnathus scovelli]